LRADKMLEVSCQMQDQMADGIARLRRPGP
jgi:hypothetical protein